MQIQSRWILCAGSRVFETLSGVFVFKIRLGVLLCERYVSYVTILSRVFCDIMLIIGCETLRLLMSLLETSAILVRRQLRISAAKYLLANYHPPPRPGHLSAHRVPDCTYEPPNAP